MEKRDEELIAQWQEQDPELKRYVDEHRKLEKLLEGYNRRPYLTTQESLERKRLQKVKLAGRDKIETILAKYRQKEEAS